VRPLEPEKRYLPVSIYYFLQLSRKINQKSHCQVFTLSVVYLILDE
jgi:hypothetical protein